MELELLVLYSLLFSVLFLITGTAFSAPAVAVCCEISAWKYGKKFGDKFAQQISRLGLICSIIFLLLFGAGMAWDYYAQQLLLPRLSSLTLPHLVLPCSLFILGLTLLAVYWATWKRLKRKKTTHCLLGLLSALAWGATFYLLAKITIKLISAEPFALLDPAFWFHWVKTFQSPVSPFFWPFLIQSVLIALGASGILGLVYLLLRREKDAFGRDYYRWAVPFAVRWSLIFPLQILAYLWIYILSPAYLQKPFLSSWFSIPSGLGLILTLCALLVWINILRSPNPLRLKGRIICSALLIWIALAAFALGTYAGLWPSLINLFQITPG